MTLISQICLILKIEKRLPNLVEANVVAEDNIKVGKQQTIVFFPAIGSSETQMQFRIGNLAQVLADEEHIGSKYRAELFPREGLLVALSNGQLVEPKKYGDEGNTRVYEFTPDYVFGVAQDLGEVIEFAEFKLQIYEPSRTATITRVSHMVIKKANPVLEPSKAHYSAMINAFLYEGKQLASPTRKASLRRSQPSLAAFATA